MINKYLLILAWLVAHPAAYAEKTDRDKPIEITANKGCSWDQIRDITVCQGDVIVTQGTLTVHAEHAIVSRDADGNQTLVATGKLVTFRQKADSSDPHSDEWINGQGTRVDYTTMTHTAVLTGNARIKKGESIVIGDVIIYNTNTQVVESRGGATHTANKGRVTAILPPRKPSVKPVPNEKTP